MTGSVGASVPASVSPPSPLPEPLELADSVELPELEPVLLAAALELPDPELPDPLELPELLALPVPLELPCPPSPLAACAASEEPSVCVTCPPSAPAFEPPSVSLEIADEEQVLSASASRGSHAGIVKVVAAIQLSSTHAGRSSRECGQGAHVEAHADAHRWAAKH
jgi:hypothetical protein